MISFNSTNDFVIVGVNLFALFFIILISNLLIEYHKDYIRPDDKVERLNLK
jgi:hypothetical protein